MSFFPTAFADGVTTTTAGAGQSQASFWIMLVVIVVMFYFVLYLPQSRRTKQHRQLLANLGKGDEVVTNAGIMGKVDEIQETYIKLEIAQGVFIRLQKQAITSVLPKGSIEKS